MTQQEKAQTFEKEGQFREALKIYLLLAQENPDNMDYLVHVGRLHGDLQEWVPAENALKKCLQRDPNDVGALITLSYVYYWQKKYREAIAEAEKALQNEPNNVDALLAAANSYRLGGDVRVAEKYFKEALRLQPERCDVHLLMGGLMQAERRYKKAYKEYLLCFQTDSHDLLAERGVITTKPFVRPSLEGRSFYSQEREQDLLLPITTTKMTTINEALTLTYPVNDKWMPYTGVVYDLQVQYNLVAKENNYRVNSYFQNVGCVFRFGDFWSLDVESKVHFARNKGDVNLLPFQNVTKWEPKAILKYVGTEHFFVFGALKDSIISRLFALNQSQLAPRKGLLTAYEYRFKVPYNGVGVAGNVAWYGGNFPNREQDYSLWLRFRIPAAVPNFLIRYEFSYQGFKDVVGAYYSFKWRNQHLGKITYHKEWVPRAYFDLSYSYLWSDTHQLTNQSEVILPGASNIPAAIQKNIFRANIVEALIHYVQWQSLHLEFAGRYYHDTNNYRSWSLLGGLQMVF